MGANNHDHADADTTDDDVDVYTGVDETEDDADTSQNTDANDGDDDDSADDADEDDSSEDGDDEDGKGDSKSSDAAEDEDTEGDDDDGEEPESRSTKNYKNAAQRIAKKAAQKSGDDKHSDDKDDDSEDADDDLSPEDATAIDKRIAKALSPFQKKEAEQEVEASIATFLQDNPDFSSFASKVRRFANHPSRSSVPIKSIFYEVAGDKLLKMGAQRSKAADVKAKKGRTGGGNATTDGKGSKDYANMPLDDFGKELEDIKIHGKRA